VLEGEELRRLLADAGMQPQGSKRPAATRSPAPAAS
jgi:hypothetical protein